MLKNNKIIIAMILAVAIIVINPLQIFAAGQEKYISEIVVETGKTANEAKKKLEDAGYTVYDKNLSNTENDTDTCGYMYLGYKVTTNPDEAITDIRLMHMGGGYSYAEYEQILEQKKNEISALVAQLNTAVQEFRVNYLKQKKAAVVAYTMLNQLVEDDSGLYMGDYFLDTTKTTEDYTKIMMQSSTVVLITIENALAIACSATNENALAELENLTAEDMAGMTQYEAIATDIYNDLGAVQKSLEEFMNSGSGIWENKDLTVEDQATEDEINAIFDSLSEEEAMSWTDSFAFACLLQSIKLGDGTTLFDLFTSDLDEITTEDLYPLASVLSDGQAALINVVGIKNILTAASNADEKWESIDEYSYKVEEPISIYTGIDRSLFEGGVALTNKAMVEAAANTEKGWFGGMSSETEEIFYEIIGISFFTYFGALAVSLIARSLFKHVVLTEGSRISGMVTISLGGENVLSPIVQTAFARYLLTLKVIKYVYTAFTYITFIALGVLLIAATIYLVALGINYYFPDYDEVPKILVEKNTVNEQTEYTYYYGIKNISGKVVDFNQHDGSRWSALYTTKDKNAGKPILADLVVAESQTLTGYVGVRKFSQDAAFDLNRFSYNLGFNVDRDGGEEKINSSYMFFKQSNVTNESKAASIFTSENAIIGACSLAAGLLIGIIGTAIYSKKKYAVKPVEEK